MADLPQAVASARSDEELIARCLEHDEGAWAALVDRYAAYIYTIATRAYGLDGEDAAEAFQESLLKIFEGLSSYQGKGEFRSWLRQVVRNTCAGQLRRSRRSEPLQNEMADRSQEETLERIERAYMLNQMLAELDESCRQVLSMFFFEGKSYRNISQALNLAEGTVGSRLARCLTKLRARLSEEEKT